MADRPSSTKSKIAVLVLDGREMVRASLKNILNVENGVAVVEEIPL